MTILSFINIKFFRLNLVGLTSLPNGKFVLSMMLTILSSTSHAAEYQTIEKNKMLNAFDQFVVSETAAKNCLLPSQEEFSKFDANFDVVSNFAFLEMSQQFPYIQQQKISETLALKARALSLRTEHKIKARGCQDPAIQAILQRYQMQARWEPAIGF
ncbi:hypothetical protein [Thiomicrorhabdus sediminis]|uniref:Uncharacterized protein n=1 Tax=Thiomicrorhabdus sediminis TaxID=2580412 RepID=A0A4P9K687_9GAMM|nr:hypothetical protein [Thiomicrorhabdus sediminis]QCU90341.1 hypothetical protein FE785_06710 [Thiomicrorhabdus sediminis]